MKILIIFCLFGGIWAVPNCTQIKDMTLAIADAARLLDGAVPLLVRLSFHDCAGGCDGCVNFGNDGNKGLEPIVNMLDKLYPQFSDFVSKADFYALSASVGVTLGLQQSNSQRTGKPCTYGGCCNNQVPCPIPCFQLSWGRKDNPNCPLEVLPTAEMMRTEMLAYFKDNFGFSPPEVVALMGAHSLGGARRNNSGYFGKFTAANIKGFNEAFYANILDKTKTWPNVDVGDEWQFSANWNTALAMDIPPQPSAGMMLNTDVELYYDISITAEGQATCTFPRSTCVADTCLGACPKVDTFDLAAQYASNCPKFVHDFQQVYQKMLLKGSNIASLTTTQCDCIFPPPQQGPPQGPPPKGPPPPPKGPPPPPKGPPPPPKGSKGVRKLGRFINEKEE